MNQYDYKKEALKNGKKWTVCQHRNLIKMTKDFPHMWESVKLAVFGYEMAMREKGW